MKRNVKKLTLARETVRDLDEIRLREAGGAAPRTWYASCQVSNCGSCYATCDPRVC